MSDVFLDSFMKNLNSGDLFALRSARHRIGLLPDVRADTDELKFQERLQLLRTDLSMGTDSVRADVHTPFRLLAKALFCGENDFLMMRHCLGVHLKHNASSFVNDHSQGETLLYANFLRAIRRGGDCKEYWYFIFQLCADLFMVTLYCIASGGHYNIFEFAPTGVDPITKKEFWLVFNLDSYEGWNTLLPRGSDPFVPENGKVMNIRLFSHSRNS